MEHNRHGFVVWIASDDSGASAPLRGSVEHTRTSIRSDFESGDELLSLIEVAIRNANGGGVETSRVGPGTDVR